MSSSRDAMHTFQLQRAGVRGVVVRLDEAWEEIRQHSDPSPAVRGQLGESVVASALFAGALRFEGSLSIHLRNAGALRLMFAECTHDGRLRGIARVDEETDCAGVDLGDPRAQLAITIENTRTETRYQGLVAVEADSLSRAFEGYFERSEQLPTRIVLAASDSGCAGIMLQKIAESNERGLTVDADAWNRVGHLLASLREQELLELPVETLLLRLFHEEDVLLQPARPLSFQCSCSRERVLGMFRSLGQEQALDALDEHGKARITCEFCNRTYEVDRIDVAALFAGHPNAPGSTVSQ